MNKYTIIIYAENASTTDWPIGEVAIRASDFARAEEVAALMFENTGRLIIVE
mgnify:CR=1 FL=1|tara:strand:+ start:42 stop:197 length:156 start_codon:yes stop_codon:yes gene_type:complete